jgi:FAD/FMN-containing dehydrogenase
MLSLARLNSTNCANLRKTPRNIQGSNHSYHSNRNEDKDDSSAKVITIDPGLKVETFMKEVLYDQGYIGIVASAAGVGMGGFVLGGGYGLQSRMYGLAIDNVVGMNVVLTSGETKYVSDGDDLFWAMRGSGGGNFGLVTQFDYKVYPSHDIKLVASVKVTIEEMTHFLHQLGAIEHNLKPEFTVTVQGYQPLGNRTSLDTIPAFSKTGVSSKGSFVKDEEGLVTVSMYFMGDSNPDEQVGMDYIKESIVPLFLYNATKENVVYYYFSWSGLSRQQEQDKTWSSLFSAQSWNGFLLPENNTKEVWYDIESSLSAMFRYCKFISPKIELWGGAISKVAPNATAFPHRNAVFNIGIELLVPDWGDAESASDESHLVNAIWPSISRHLNGVYINFPMPSLSKEEYPAAYWKTNLPRLKHVKQQYDPFHVLTFSQSIPVLNNTSSDA